MKTTESAHETHYYSFDWELYSWEIKEDEILPNYMYVAYI